MPKGKGSKKDQYVSQGQVRNVNQKTLNAMRAERKANFDMRSWKARHDHRNFVMSRPEPSYAKLRKEYEYEEYVDSRANELFEQYKHSGITWAACVQAVRTNWVSQLHNKWASKLRGK